MPRHSKMTKYTRDKDMIAGLKKHRERLDRGSHPEWLRVDKLIARFQEHLDAMADVSRRETEWQLALDREETLEQGIKELMVRVKLMLQTSFHPSDAQLRDFGVKPLARRKPSMETLERAIQKRRATRALRRTMGRKQRARIKAGS